jgi:MFS family permease
VTVSETESRRHRYLGPIGQSFTALSVADYRNLIASNFASQIGQWVQQVAQGWLAYQLTGSATFLGAVATARSVPSFFFTLPGGVLADRWDRRRIIMISQFTMMLNAAVLAVLVIADRIEPWHLLVSAAVGGTTMAINMPARQSLAPELAGPERIANAVALNAISFNFSRILGPSIAGFLLAVWGIGPCYLTQAGMLVISMLWTARIGAEDVRHGKSNAAQGSIWANLVEGLVYIRHSPTLMGVMIVAIVPIYLETTYQQLLPVFADDVLNVGAPGLAGMVTAIGVGSMIGGFVMAALSNHPRKGAVMIFIGTFSGITLAGFAVSTWMPLTLVLLAITGLTQAVTMAMGQTMANLIIPNEFRGRVMSVYLMLWSSSPLVMLPAGWATDHYGAPITVFVSGLLVIAFFVVAGLRRSVVRDFREEPVLLMEPV